LVDSYAADAFRCRFLSAFYFELLARFLADDVMLDYALYVITLAIFAVSLPLRCYFADVYYDDISIFRC